MFWTNISDEGLKIIGNIFWEIFWNNLLGFFLGGGFFSWGGGYLFTYFGFCFPLVSSRRANEPYEKLHSSLLTTTTTTTTNWVYFKLVKCFPFSCVPFHRRVLWSEPLLCTGNCQMLTQGRGMTCLCPSPPFHFAFWISVLGAEVWGLPNIWEGPWGQRDQPLSCGT